MTDATDFERAARSFIKLPGPLQIAVQVGGFRRPLNLPATARRVPSTLAAADPKRPMAPTPNPLIAIRVPTSAGALAVSDGANMPYAMTTPAATAMHHGQ